MAVISFPAARRDPVGDRAERNRRRRAGANRGRTGGAGRGPEDAAMNPTARQPPLVFPPQLFYLVVAPLDASSDGHCAARDPRFSGRRAGPAQRGRSPSRSAAAHCRMDRSAALLPEDCRRAYGGVQRKAERGSINHQGRYRGCRHPTTCGNEAISHCPASQASAGSVTSCHPRQQRHDLHLAANLHMQFQLQSGSRRPGPGRGGPIAPVSSRASAVCAEIRNAAMRRCSARGHPSSASSGSSSIVMCAFPSDAAPASQHAPARSEDGRSLSQVCQSSAGLRASDELPPFHTPSHTSVAKRASSHAVSSGFSRVKACSCAAPSPGLLLGNVGAQRLVQRPRRQEIQPAVQDHGWHADVTKQRRQGLKVQEGLRSGSAA